jgi:hypothetical protein
MTEPIQIYQRHEKRKAFAFISPVDPRGPHFAEVDIAVPTDEGEALRNERIACHVSLREAAAACGLTHVQYSGLECGGYGTDEWPEVMRRVYALVTRGTP